MDEKKDIFDFIEKRPNETPDASYFEHLANNTLQQVQAEKSDAASKKETGKVIPLYRRSLFWVASAAAAVLIAFLMLPEKEISTTEALSFDDVSKKELLAYVDENIDDFDVELLAEFIPVNRLKNNTSATTKQEVAPLETIVDTKNTDLKESLESISSDEILNYFEEEGIDMNDSEDDLFL